MGQEGLDLSVIWVALGMARDSYAKVIPNTGLTESYQKQIADFHRKRASEMQLVRDKVEERIRMLTELEEYDHGL